MATACAPAVFAVTASCGEARTGQLRGKLETPAVLLYTRRGFPAPLTLRELEALSKAVHSGGAPAALAMQVSAAELLDEPGANVLRQVPRGLREFCGLHARDDFVLLSARDLLTTQAGMPASEGWATLQTPAGQKKVTAAEYCDLVGAAQPDAAVCLSDEVFSDSNDKKLKKSVERTAAWMDECLKARAEAQISAGTLLFGPIVGGASERDRERSAQEAAKRSALDGYAIVGLGCGETQGARELHVQACLKHLDPAKPRLISGLWSPEEVLWAAAKGMDLLESSYPFVAATHGLALTFRVSYDELMERGGSGSDHRRAQDRADGSGGRGGKLNLWDTCHARDVRAIAPGCSCLVCAHYSRAYLHHLLNTHEMLAEVFLTCHNHHVYLDFFASIRWVFGELRQRAIGEKALASYTEAFEKMRQAAI